ncbi:hypothetical protein [Nocardiopsis metallicus]|uniref:Uncharacterized protein n=1 Tax=Nocardiopsis metallicus TaxID=179819 RepID=A0A840WQT2_9ACTN|nr:hypothetical protein [Nocardiopsis metallicus]MBB5494205.1 hypothetical protein [Nocardiopsis metallicus]
MKPQRVVAGFDSATAMLNALSSYNAAENSPTGGETPKATARALAVAAGIVNRIPRPAKERLYAVSGWYEAIQAHSVRDVRSDELAEWIVRHHPRKQADVAFVGSANGALTHLAAALEAPWIPQTLLIPVRRHGVPPEDGEKDLLKMRSTGQDLLRANPDWRLHHMHDPNQDRLMVAGMCYFRVKWLRLPEAYRAYLRRTLEPGGTLVVSDCAMRWPTTRVEDRYVFQHGGFGGATLDELRYGSERVRDYLRAYDSDYTSFVAPEPDGDSPEAEWGFAEELMDDLRELAEQQGWTLLRLRHDEPESLSPPVADMYRGWHRRRGLPSDRLLVESFMLVEPYWALRSGSVPFWTVFNKEPSLRALEEYLDRSPAYEEIRMGLFSHGVESVGLARADQWQAVLDRATKVGTFLGTDPSAFPRDFAVLFRFREELAKVRGRQPMPVRMPWAEAAEAMTGAPGVELIEERI